MATATTTAHATTEPAGSGGRHHWIVAALVGVAILLLGGYAARSSIAISTVAAARRDALLANKAFPHLSDAQIRAALGASPLKQRLVNVAMVRAVHRGEPLAPWIAQVSRLGWRDTTSLQNKLYVEALAKNIPGLLSTADALLRRQQLVDQIAPILSVLELDPSLRAQLVDVMAKGPGWNGLYLRMTGHLKQPDQMMARFRTLHDLFTRGIKLDRFTVAQNIRLFDQNGLYGPAFALWKTLNPSATRPLDDTQFTHAAVNVHDDDNPPLAFEWQPMSGNGYDAGASLNNGRSALDIDWNGRGLPIFAQQRTSGPPGLYELDVETGDDHTPISSLLTFNLVCDNQTVALSQNPGKHSQFVTAEPVPCSFPVLQIAGALQPTIVSHDVTLTALRLRHVDGGH